MYILDFEDFEGGFWRGFWAVAQARITRRDECADYAKADDRSARIRDFCRTDVPILVDGAEKLGDPGMRPRGGGSFQNGAILGMKSHRCRF